MKSKTYAEAQFRMGVRVRTPQTPNELASEAALEAYFAAARERARQERADMERICWDIFNGSDSQATAGQDDRAPGL